MKNAISGFGLLVLAAGLADGWVPGRKEEVLTPRQGRQFNYQNKRRYGVGCTW